MTLFSSSDAEAGATRPQRQQLGPCLRGASRPLRDARITGNMDTSKPTKAAWDQSLSHTIEQACERAILKLFSDAHDEAARQALAQAFLAGVDWCFSEQSDNDIAEAALAIGLSPDEAVTGAIPQMVSSRAC
jgi:hypothetical protein